MKFRFLLLAILFLQLSVSIASVPTVVTKKDSATAYVSKDDEAMVQNAVAAFKKLSRKERKARIADAKALFKNYKSNAVTSEANSDTVLLAILAVLLPPLAVYLHESDLNARFWISLLLTLLFWLPGVIYALIIVLTK